MEIRSKWGGIGYAQRRKKIKRIIYSFHKHLLSPIKHQSTVFFIIYYPTASTYVCMYVYMYVWLCWVFIAACGLLIVVASLVAEHGL